MREQIIIPEINELKKLEKQRGKLQAKTAASAAEMATKASEIAALNEATKKECTALRYQQAQLLNLALGGEN